MNCVKDILEMAYYVAFIILTYLIVKYSRKTFLLQAQKSHNVLCKICVIGEQANHQTKYGLELYNYGNDIAKDVTIKVQDALEHKCDFIKPNESVVYPIGTILHVIAGNRVLFENMPKELEPGEPIEVVVNVDGKSSQYSLSTDILFSVISGNELSEISKSIERVASEISHINRR